MWTLPDPGIEPVSLALKPDSLPLSHQGSPREHILRGIMVNWNNMQGRMTCLGKTWQPCYHGWPGRRRGQGSWGWSSVFMVKGLGFSLESPLTWCPFYLIISSGLQSRCVWGAWNLWKSELTWGPAVVRAKAKLAACSEGRCKRMQRKRPRIRKLDSGLASGYRWVTLWMPISFSRLQFLQLWECNHHWLPTFDSNGSLCSNESSANLPVPCINPVCYYGYPHRCRAQPSCNTASGSDLQSTGPAELSALKLWFSKVSPN